MLGEQVITEAEFLLPANWATAIQAISTRDFRLVQAVVLLNAASFFCLRELAVNIL